MHHLVRLAHAATNQQHMRGQAAAIQRSRSPPFHFQACHSTVQSSACTGCELQQHTSLIPQHAQPATAEQADQTLRAFAFLARTLPADSMANPACMKNTCRARAGRVQPKEAN